MKTKLFGKLELIGVSASLLAAIFLWNLYEMTGGSPIGVVFGSVNRSLWEKAKPLTECYIFFALLELVCARPRFKNYVVAKTVGLCLGTFLFFVFDGFFGVSVFADVLFLFLSYAAAFSVSYLLSVSKIDLSGYFAPACFLLAVIFVMTACFTAFPPRIFLFRDARSGYCGVLPKNIDMGAVELR